MTAGSSSSTQSLPFRLKSRQKAESSNAMSARERRLFNNIDMPERGEFSVFTLKKIMVIGTKRHKN